MEAGPNSRSRAGVPAGAEGAPSAARIAGAEAKRVSARGPSNPAAAANPRQRTARRLSADLKRLTPALIASILVHALLLSLTFAGDGLGLPGLHLPWRDRLGQVPDLRVVLQSAAGSPSAIAATSRLQAPGHQPSMAVTASARAIERRRTATAAAPPQVRQAATSTAPAPARSPAPERTTAPSPEPAARAAPLPMPEGPSAVATLGATSVNAAPPPQRDPNAAEGSAQAEPIAPSVDVLSGDDAARQKPQREEAVPTAPRPAGPPQLERTPGDAGAGEEVRQAVADKEPDVVRQPDGAQRREEQTIADSRQETAPAQTAQRETETRTTAQPDSVHGETAREVAAGETAAREAAAREEAAREAAALEAAAKEAAAREQAVREAAAREAAAREAAAREAAAKEAAAREAAAREAAAKEAAAREAAAREAATREAMVAEAQRRELRERKPAREEAARVDGERREAARREAEARQDEEARREARLRAIGRQLDAEADQRLAASTARRARLWGRADANAELIRYAEAWERKIQLNTSPETVRDLARRTRNRPIVTVAVRSDGSVESVTFVVSSGDAEVDEAIRRIVHGHAHYQPFWPALAAQYDVIEIRRTWHFDDAIRFY
jgi:outer membrane biosynthesis protein TonB